VKFAESQPIEVGVFQADGTRRDQHDAVVVEEPLEIRVAGDVFATTMRTPGHDRELVLGFLWAEGIIRSPDDISSMSHCGRPGDEGYGNVMEVTLVSTVKFDPDRAMKRGTLATSACGVCGRRTIEDLLGTFSKLDRHPPILKSTVCAAVASLRQHQPTFSKTGGCHAASLVRFNGEHVCTFEDVGRHNAVDKVVGSRLLARQLALSDCMLIVSGRTSFEIVQKAMAARIPVVASVSAASSLAVALARNSAITLIGFVRDGAVTVYAGKDCVKW
jgi:FdhD protein